MLSPLETALLPQIQQIWSPKWTLVPTQPPVAADERQNEEETRVWVLPPTLPRWAAVSFAALSRTSETNQERSSI